MAASYSTNIIIYAGASGAAHGSIAMGLMTSRLSTAFPLLPVISAAQTMPVVPSMQAPTAAGIATAAGSVVPAQAASAGPLVAVPAKLVQRISNLEFVEMYEPLPESWLVTEGNEGASSGQAKAVCLFPKRRKAPVTDALVWEQCFAAMAGVLSTKYPTKVPEFMAYQALIVKCSRDYEGIGWVLYDRAFRRAGGGDEGPELLNPTLHSLCLAGRARRNKFCSACLSDNHSVEQCPEAWQMFPPFGSAGQYRSASPLSPFYPHPGPFPFGAGGGQPPAPPFGPPGVPTCKLFNKLEGPRCTFTPCKYAHVCTICRGPHARAECRARAAAAKRPRLA